MVKLVRFIEICEKEYTIQINLNNWMRYFKKKSVKNLLGEWNILFLDKSERISCMMSKHKIQEM